MTLRVADGSAVIGDAQAEGLHVDELLGLVETASSPARHPDTVRPPPDHQNLQFVCPWCDFGTT